MNFEQKNERAKLLGFTGVKELRTELAQTSLAKEISIDSILSDASINTIKFLIVTKRLKKQGN